MTHYYSENKDSKFKPFKIKVNVLGKELDLYSCEGLFSKKELDAGTKTLIENAIIDDDNRILDIGCGYGVVGIFFGIKYDVSVLMTDVNEHAVKVSKMNIRERRLEKVCSAKKSDLYSNIVDEKFDVILTNPPHTAGREVCYNIIIGAFEHLNENGTLQLVARHNKGGKMLEKKMNEVFGNVDRIGKDHGFTVYLSRKS